MKRYLKLYGMLAVLFVSQHQIFAQTGSLKGTVIDQSTGETLPGASIFIDGTTQGTTSDFDGNYTLVKINPGSYRIMVSMVSYNKKAINQVVVKADEVTTLHVSMEAATNSIKEIVIEAEAKKESLNAMLIQQKNAMSVSDGVSAETIKKTPDRNTGDVIKRVSGASIQENKFAIIRGLNDRYNAAFLNGAPLPSSESDRKAFAFDIFPANMLDNIIINKTATPDMPAEFGGGIIQINTKSIPEENFFSLSAGAGYNTMTTGKNQLTYQGGKTDKWGIDDGTRALPADFPARKDFPTLPLSQANLAKSTASNTWAIDSSTFAPNTSYQLAMGRHFKHHDKDVLGITVAANYNRSYNYLTTERKSYNSSTVSDIASQIESSYLDQTYATQTLAGILANIGTRINANHSISCKNILSINADDRVIRRTGTPTPLDPNPTLIRSTAQWFTSNKIYSGQLQGDHLLGNTGIKINWIGGYSDIERSIPNLRRNIYTRFSKLSDPNYPNPFDTVYTANISQANVGPDYGGGMFYANNKETMYSGRVDLSYQLSLGKQFKNTFKLGAYYQQRARDFSSRQLGYTKWTRYRDAATGTNYFFSDSLLRLDESQIFNAQNMGIVDTSEKVLGFKLKDATKPSDAYQASANLQAAYAMMDTRVGERIRLIWGARAESYTQQLNAILDNNDTLQLQSTMLDILPSANFILSLNEKQNLRACYSQTLNRPEFRELAPFAFYDFNTQFVYSGYDSLQRALIHNYDLRYEFYAGRGQLLSATVFYKSFINPIEQISRADVPGEISYRNVAAAQNYGAELEFRVIVGALLDVPSKWLNNLTAYANYAFIRSSVDVSQVVGSIAQSRPLQGQSPYIVNAGLLYNDNDLGFSFAAAVNRVGQRIAIVGNINEPDIWENGRTVVDLQLSKQFWKNKIELKLFARDLLAQKLYFYQDTNKNEKLDYNSDDLIWVSKFAPTYSASLSLKF